MGVYIKDLAMPTSCNKCPFTCEALQFFNGTDRPYSCPLIEIDLVKCEECAWSNGECSVGERYQGGCSFGEIKGERFH